MRVGIIEAGEPPPALASQFGTYVTMTRRLLGESHEYEAFRLIDGRVPKGGECEAFVITGSACSVYDKRPWIADLECFLRSERHRVRLVGICFGHQIMAQAFGGQVKKAAQGWGLGLQRYEIRKRAAWMDDVDAIRAIASHQDQVSRLPSGCMVLGASKFTPYAILAYRESAAISFQFHPEFDALFCEALFSSRRAPDLREEQVLQAIGSLSRPNDNERIGRWINRFLDGTKQV